MGFKFYGRVYLGQRCSRKATGVPILAAAIAAFTVVGAPADIGDAGVGEGDRLGAGDAGVGLRPVGATRASSARM